MGQKHVESLLRYSHLPESKDDIWDALLRRSAYTPGTICPCADPFKLSLL